jgi:hypothetical protein
MTNTPQLPEGTFEALIKISGSSCNFNSDYDMSPELKHYRTHQAIGKNRGPVAATLVEIVHINGGVFYYLDELDEIGTISGTEAMLVSDRARKIIEMFQTRHIEYIPLIIECYPPEPEVLAEVDYRPDLRRIRSDPGEYWMVNCFEFQDIIDKRKSVCDWYKVIRNTFDPPVADPWNVAEPIDAFKIQNLVINALDPDTHLFGLIGLYGSWFISYRLYSALRNANIQMGPLIKVLNPAAEMDFRYQQDELRRTTGVKPQHERHVYAQTHEQLPFTLFVSNR